MKPDNELEILHPDRTIEVGEEQVTVREFTWVEAIELAGVAEPILEALQDLFTSEQEISLQAISELVTRHREAMFHLISVSIDRPVQWLTSLSDEQGLLLLSTFWEVNQGFFTRRIMMAMLGRRPDSPVSSQH